MNPQCTDCRGARIVVRVDVSDLGGDAVGGWQCACPFRRFARRTREAKLRQEVAELLAANHAQAAFLTRVMAARHGRAACGTKAESEK